MNRRAQIFVSVMLLTLVAATAVAENPLVRREWKVDGVTREALVYAPKTASTQAAPLVFIFHGHGGKMDAMARRYAMQDLWPEAICVYPQGLNTPGRLTDPEGKRPGWQHSAGAQGDRDLKLFDSMLESLKQDYRVDEKRVFATGHSNGGGFTYLLWAERGEPLAAVAPTAAAGSPEMRGKIKPKPALHLAGETDPLVKFEWQKATIDAIRKVNQCGDGEPWGEHCTRYPSKVGAPVVTYIHAGGHGFPDGANAVIAKFFKENPKP
jgi:polyhydroxybutyrate depolymerase